MKSKGLRPPPLSGDAQPFAGFSPNEAQLNGPAKYTCDNDKKNEKNENYTRTAPACCSNAHFTSLLFLEYSSI